MSHPTGPTLRQKLVVAIMLLAFLSSPCVAADATGSGALVSLINRLVERGVLSKADANDLILLAEADAAEARAQQAMTQAALARAEAAEARARAIAATGGRSGGTISPSAEERVAALDREDEKALAAVRARLAATPPASGQSSPPADDEPAPRRHVAATASQPPSDDDSVAAPVSPRRAARRAQSPADDDSVASAPTASPQAPSRQAVVDPATSSTDSAAADDDSVRVTYVPEVVRREIRAQVKQDVLDEARKEGWATPQAVPSWVSKVRLFGDLRIRYEGDYYPAGNDNTGAFPNFNAINTGAPFDTSGSIFSPQLNVDQPRNRVRIRARVGSEVDLGQSFAIGLRAGTGENDSPVSENQTLGTANGAQGGNFQKYALWLDRAFLKYEVGGLPDEDLTLAVGRFDNPFFASSMIWADDLGFDGAVVKGKFGVGEDVTPFFAVGAFPVFNTELNFSSTSPAKFKSYDKWLLGSQLGTTFDLGQEFTWKVAAAYYYYHNVEGRLSDPFTPLSSSDQGDTDDSRPAFAQVGNTYMALRDIVASPLNQNGTIDQFQYFGLASKFHELAFTTRLDWDHFQPLQVSLLGEYVRNLGFDSTAVGAIAVNNRGAISSGASTGVYQGSNSAWLVRLNVGAAAMLKRWDWNFNIGYRNVGSDAVVDGFADSDFGLGGTNWKGPTLGGSVALSPAVWVSARWMSARAIAGPTLKSDILQLDLNGKF